MRWIGIIACFIGGMTTALPAAGQSDAPATGFAISVRTPSGALGDVFATATGSPIFTLGHRGERFGFGVGAGITLFRSSDEDEFPEGTSRDETRASAFQVGPSAWIDVWQSDDGRTRGNITGGVTVGRLSTTDESTFTPTGGAEQTSESSTTGTILGVRLALGGDHFLHSNFALGLEAGIQNTFLLDVGEDETADIAQSTSFGANGTYGALRATIVFD